MNTYHVDYTGDYGYEFPIEGGIVWFSGTEWDARCEHIVLEADESEEVSDGELAERDDFEALQDYIG